jgi:hypothetical protein
MTAQGVNHSWEIAMSPVPELVPDDIVSAASIARDVLSPLLNQDWEILAHGMTWNCRRTLDHISDAIMFYSALLATRATARRSWPRWFARRLRERARFTRRASVMELDFSGWDVKRSWLTPGISPRHSGSPSRHQLIWWRASLLVSSPGRRQMSPPGKPCSGPLAESPYRTTSDSMHNGRAIVRPSPSGMARSGGGKLHPPGEPPPPTP